ncbi:AHL_G0031450.mRNA.1.CDS.1 [Saccharomyces cerevisiae]|nr:AHL_G0031450.mRNA.1.CDS.1 [Saccharomyces cerevisiae]CAI6757438.1 AHL_G0031450.mRNA.1.CDS.1 [Saccharomyces cerevisiae]
MILGLQYDPCKYKRIRNPQHIRRRRLLWLGVQSLRFQITLPEGNSDKTNNEYMEMFLADSESTKSSSNDFASAMDEFYVQFSDIAWEKYQFHVLLNKLISSYTSIVENPLLYMVLENIKRSEDFMLEHFPLDLIYSPLNDPTLNTVPFSKGSILNICDVKKDGSIHDKYCWTYMHLQHFGQVSGMISDYLDTRFGGNIPQQYEYIVNKQVCFTLIRIWLFQCRILLRLSYKQETEMKRFSPNGTQAASNVTRILARLIQHIRNQMAYLIDLASKRLQQCYFGTFQAVEMFRYINTAKYTANNRLKMGTESKNSSAIKRKLTSAQTLESFNELLLGQMEGAVLGTSFGQKSNTVMSSNLPEEAFNVNEEETLSQLLESNFDLFWDLLGENMSDVYSL